MRFVTEKASEKPFGVILKNIINKQTIGRYSVNED